MSYQEPKEIRQRNFVIDVYFFFAYQYISSNRHPGTRTLQQLPLVRRVVSLVALVLSFNSATFSARWKSFLSLLPLTFIPAFLHVLYTKSLPLKLTIDTFS